MIPGSLTGMGRFRRRVRCLQRPAGTLARYNPRMRKWSVTSALLLSCGALLVAGDDTALREFLKDEKFADGWIYEDIDAGYEQATASGKPLLVCFCCVP